MQSEQGNENNKFQELYKHIDKLLKEKERVIVVIEGGSASGKTTLAEELNQRYHCNIFHMDDFFLRPAQRTQERLEEPGGNVDRERFYEEVVIPLSKGGIINYSRFDCSTLSLLPPQKIEASKLNVIEGAYSTHPEFGKYYDLSVFLEINSDLQKERIEKRNGLKKAERFFKEWIPMEQKYFKTFHIKEKCDINIQI